ncbi:hypothetical protein F4778DRAFT_234874 [Xylariomycetidae sp. FL2044]|nr:hypothetical protein F4778DRAFT_234874 [Xylariomycetidae sp. FL2044]
MNNGKGDVEQVVKDHREPPIEPNNACGNAPTTTVASSNHDTLSRTSVGVDVTTSTPYRPFPPTMRAYYQWNLSGLRTFHVCGDSETERLFAVKIHSGLSRRLPLGTRPGLHLYNGPETETQLLAAAGDESQRASTPYGFNTNSIIVLPSLKRMGLVEERMCAHTTAGQGIAFRFDIEVGLDLKLRRETFEWRKITKKEQDDETKSGGFRLVWLSSDPEQTASTSAGSSSSSRPVVPSPSSTDSLAKGGGQEVVAIFSWTRTLTNLKHPFDFRFVGSGLAGKMGDRWALMAVITALRLWYLHMNLKTNWGTVAAAEKVTGVVKKATSK